MIDLSLENEELSLSIVKKINVEKAIECIQKDIQIIKRETNILDNVDIQKLKVIESAISAIIANCENNKSVE